MLVRLGIACALVCGALTLDSVAIAPAAAGGESRTMMRGTTGQKRPVKLVVRHGSIDMIRFVAKLRCRDGTVLTDYESGFEPTPLRGNRFRDHQEGSTDDVWFRGKVRGKRVSGSIRVRDKLGKVRCDSRWFSFKASAG